MNPARVMTFVLRYGAELVAMTDAADRDSPTWRNHANMAAQYLEKIKETLMAADELPRISVEAWNILVEKELNRLGVTYDELAAQARDRSYQSVEAQKLWYLIKDAYPAKEQS
jgi:hypothetical protein